MNAKKIFKGPFVWIALAIIIVLAIVPIFTQSGSSKVDTSVGMNLLKDGKVEQAQINDGESRVNLTLKQNYEDKGKNLFFLVSNARSPEVVKAVDDANLKSYDDRPVQTNWFSSLIGYMIPFLIIVVVFWFLFSRMQGGAKAMQFGKSRAKMLSKDVPKVTFADVAGEDEAVEELQEVKEFLAEPKKFQAVGAKIPKGALLYGPPGTGKTLLARAVAGEAGVPFFTISGSDFVEMFVGVGASRVRDLFEQAKNNAPAIIFIDEIDAVGRHRGAGIGGGNDEREQTLNQLLVEMDGFDTNTNVILIAATNRPDVLDPALLRPGRFDRQIAVEAPDLKGRERILEVHAKGKPMAPGVDLNSVAKRTPGFTGADLANVLNEAALLTARSNANLIDDRALDEAIDRVIAGPQKRSRIMSEHERKITAYHEGGHALVAAALRNTDPVTKVTILPRGRALGYTMVLPSDDKYSVTRNELLDQLAYAMGGRVAEEIVFHDPSTGASNDIEKATGTARNMVMQYGMSERIGSVKLGSSGGEPFMGRDMGADRDFSDQVAFVVDEEVRKLIDNAHDEAYQILTANRDVLDRLALELLERETLNEAEIAQIFHDVRKRDFRETWLSKDSRPVQDLPPVKSSKELAAERSKAPAAELGERPESAAALAQQREQDAFDAGVSNGSLDAAGDAAATTNGTHSANETTETVTGGASPAGPAAAANPAGSADPAGGTGPANAAADSPRHLSEPSGENGQS